jgi:hypothetical protein
MAASWAEVMPAPGSTTSSWSCRTKAGVHTKCHFLSP